MALPPTHTKIEDSLLNLHRLADGNLRASMRDELTRVGQLLRLEVDIGVWTDRISERPESEQLRAARRELGFAVYAAASGLYRLAYGGIRLFIELSFAAVYFSANELHRRKWIADRMDFSWSRALDREEGVLGEAFVREFWSDGVTDASTYATQAAECYRHCSQFIHGKLAATSGLPNELTYSREVLIDWLSTGRDAAQAVLYLLYCRYAEEVSLLDDSALCAALEHSFSHLVSIRRLLGLPV